uniref:U3 snoRNP-associated protein-like EMB2271 n=1 Tax=Cannabis sativa TaxID=3483 RepID=A0A803Q2V6_CANSA
MNNKRLRPKGSKKGKASSISDEAFFGNDPKKRRKKTKNDDFIESSDSDDDFFGGSDGDDGANGDLVEETVDETRKRLATELLEKMRKSAKEEGDDDDEGGDSDKEIEEGERDSLVAQLLQQKQLEESGRLRRLVASRVQKPEASDQFQLLVKHRQPVTAVVLSEDDSKGFSAAKDGTILHWDVESGRGEKYRWPSDAVLKSHGAKDPQGRASKHSKLVFSLAVSSDGRYLASGGSDRHVHLWDTRTREHIQAFPGHRGPVSCLTFRQGTSELFSGSYDRTVKIWNAEDRAYISSLFGHQSEVLTIDCLLKREGFDECCCFISNDEFLSGTDDGSVELWSLLRKKPAYIVKNAHSLLAANKNIEQKDCPMIPNGHIENGHHTSEKYDSSSVYSWVSSVAVCRSSDLAASGAGNGSVRLWSIGSETKDIKPLYNLPVVGFVNSLAFAKSGKFIVAGVGQAIFFPLLTSLFMIYVFLYVFFFLNLDWEGGDGVGSSKWSSNSSTQVAFLRWQKQKTIL